MTTLALAMWTAGWIGCVPGGGAGDPSLEIAPSRSVTVAAAANLKFVLDPIERQFEQSHPHIDLKITCGASGSFFAQLSQRAPFDVFLSADTFYANRLVEAGYAAREGYFSYARGQIVVWVSRDSSLDLDEFGIDVLVDPSVRKIAIANPQLAPYGRAAETALKRLGVYDAVKDRLVLGDSVMQTAQLLHAGSADVGIIALSLALAPQMNGRGSYWPIPHSAYEPIEQAGVLLSGSHQGHSAAQFRSFILSGAGQEILQQYGYLPPGDRVEHPATE